MGPYTDANEILERLCQRPLIEKTRYRISDGGLMWEAGDSKGESWTWRWRKALAAGPKSEVRLDPQPPFRWGCYGT
jgi:hypothetical protein